MSTLKEFKLQNSPFTRIVRVNMEHISLARTLNLKCFPTQVFTSYWRGIGNDDYQLQGSDGVVRCNHVETIWEYLVDGILVRADRAVG
ncbi:hypothetical protein D9M68_406060 [compost metagenome]